MWGVTPPARHVPQLTPPFVLLAASGCSTMKPRGSVCRLVRVALSLKLKMGLINVKNALLAALIAKTLPPTVQNATLQTSSTTSPACLPAPQASSASAPPATSASKTEFNANTATSTMTSASVNSKPANARKVTSSTAWKIDAYLYLEGMCLPYSYS